MTPADRELIDRLRDATHEQPMATGMLYSRAAARLEELIAENERLNSFDNIVWLTGRAATAEKRAERAEAERDTQNRALAQCRALLKQEINDVVPLRERVAAQDAEIARLQRETAEIDRLRGENARLNDTQMGALARCGELLQRAREVIAERDALAKDAARYRWLREKLVYQKSGPHYGWTLDELIPGDERDAAIDAALDALNARSASAE